MWGEMKHLQQTFPAGIMALMWVLLLLTLAAAPFCADCLRINDVAFADYAMLGQTVTLVCEYEVGEGEHVDSIKWYKDSGEFYRIVPNTPVPEEDRVVVFPRRGVNVDRKKSGVSFSNFSTYFHWIQFNSFRRFVVLPMTIIARLKKPELRRVVANFPLFPQTFPLFHQASIF